jgi:guanylate kinase
MRHNEVNGKDYHFINSEQFSKLESQNHFFEVTSYNNKRYGSPRSCLNDLTLGKSYIAITDRPGIQSYTKDKAIQDSTTCIPIWICPPSIEILHQRLKQRNTENPIDLERRCVLGSQEYEEEKKSPLCRYHIVNHHLDTATDELVTIIKSCLLNENKE